MILPLRDATSGTASDKGVLSG